MNPRPSRSHNKIEIIEDKKITVKNIMERLELGDKLMETKINREKSVFLSN